MVTTKDAYEIGEIPPLGDVPQYMYAQLIRPERFGEPIKAFQVEQVETPAELSRARRWSRDGGRHQLQQRLGRAAACPSTSSRRRRTRGRHDGLPHRRQRRVRHRLRGRRGRHERQGRRRGRRPLRHVGRGRAVREGRQRPDVRPVASGSGATRRNWGSFAQFTKVQAHQCLPKPPHLTWEEAARLHARRRDRLPHAARLAAAHRRARRRRAHLGRRRRPRLDGDPDRARSSARIPIAVVSSEDKFDFCMKLGAMGCINRKDVRPLGHAAALDGRRGVRRVARRARAPSARRSGRSLGERKQPAHRLRAPGRGHDPDLDLRVRHRRHGRDLRRHHRLQRRRRPALPLDAPEAPPGLALRERRAGARASTSS